MILGAEKLGRNDLCHCGSGKKYKKCCLEVDERKANPRSLNHAGFLAVMRQMIKDNDGIYKIDFKTLQMIPPDEGIKTHYNAEDDSFELSVVKIKKSPIIQPPKRIIV